MKIPASILVALVLLAPANAQYGGSINGDAPTVSATIDFANHSKVSVKYVSILFGEGKWQSILDATGRHDRFNSRAARKPIGSITTNSDIKASGKTIPAGDYAMYFTVRASQRGSSWILNLKNKKNKDADLIQWRMAMKDAKNDSSRFTVALKPGKKTGSANITISFGSKAMVVGVQVVAAVEKKKQ